MMVTPRTITALVTYPESRVNLAGVPTRPFGAAVEMPAFEDTTL
jgi:hypothetical protein